MVTRRGWWVLSALLAPIALAAVTVATISPPPPVEAGGVVRCPGALVIAVDLPFCTHGNDAPTKPQQSAQATPSGSVVCDGDGVSGKRVQVIRARASDIPDQLPSLATVTTWAQQIDGLINASAQQTGGTRHLRYVTNPDCSLNVETVVLPASADDTFGATIEALRATGHTSPDRKYLIWVQAGYYCGIGTVISDDSPGVTNRSNTEAGYARVDQPCWNAPTAVHEVAHTLGAVQLSAPHSTGHFHATDEHENLAYADANGVTMTYPCPPENENLLDCNHDDWFSTAPSGYLATHWNVASSAWLIGNPAPPPPPSPSPTKTKSCFVIVIKICQK